MVGGFYDTFIRVTQHEPHFSVPTTLLAHRAKPSSEEPLTENRAASGTREHAEPIGDTHPACSWGRGVDGLLVG